MYSSVFVLASLALTPAQAAGEEPLLSGYRPEWRALARLHGEFLRLYEDYETETMKRVAQVAAIWESCGPLGPRLALRREQVRQTDLFCHKAASIYRQWELENQCLRSGLTMRNMFFKHPLDLMRNRAGARRLAYIELLNHRWSWEGEDEEKYLNWRCLYVLSDLLGYKGHTDRLLLSIGWGEAYLTELWPFLR